MQTDKRSLILKADDAIVFNNGDNYSDVIFDVGSSLGSDDSVLYCTIGVDYVLWTNSIYTVNLNNNIIVVNGQSFALVQAFYDVSLLLAEINLVCSLYGTASVVTDIITWTSSAPFTLGGPAC